MLSCDLRIRWKLLYLITLFDHLEFLHQVLPHRPHPCSLAVNVHWHRGQEAHHLDAAYGQENLL